MTLKRFIVMFILILDVAAFPYSCSRKFTRPSAIIGFGYIQNGDESDVDVIRYVNEKGIECNFSYTLDCKDLVLKNNKVNLPDNFETTYTIVDYEEVFNGSSSEPTSKTYKIIGWTLLSDIHAINYDNVIQLPYEYTDDDFIGYYTGHRNVIVLQPIFEQIQ